MQTVNSLIIQIMLQTCSDGDVFVSAVLFQLQIPSLAAMGSGSWFWAVVGQVSSGNL
jgi:hypothetical protein